MSELVRATVLRELRSQLKGLMRLKCPDYHKRRICGELRLLIGELS